MSLKWLSQIKRNNESKVPRRYFYLLGSLVLFSFPFILWPLVWHVVILPKARPDQHQLRVESYSPNKVIGTTLFLGNPDSSLSAYAIWKVPQDGNYKIKLNCDDNGQIYVDHHPLIFLSGISPSNQGEGEIKLNRGRHFLAVHLNNIMGKGWMKIEVMKPGRAVFEPLDVNELIFIELGNIESWLLFVQWGEIIFLSIFLFSFLVFFYLSLEKSPRNTLLILIGSTILGLFPVYVHVCQIDKFLESGGQLERHLMVINGIATDPWQYRIFAAYLLEGMIQLFKRLSFFHSVNSIFILFRCLQGVAIFLVGYLYYRRLGFSLPISFLGLSILSWGMSYSNYGSDLHFSTYFDVLFYLMAGLAISLEKLIFIIPLTAIAAFNKESSGLIPFLLLSSLLTNGFNKSGFNEPPTYRKKIISIGVISLSIYLIIFSGLRFLWGPRPPTPPLNELSHFAFLKNNLIISITWIQLFGTLGIIPIISLINYRNWPQKFKINFWVIVPIWFIIHSFGAVLAESRNFLVPQALIFIPTALFYFDNKTKSR